MKILKTTKVTFESYHVPQLLTTVNHLPYQMACHASHRLI